MARNTHEKGAKTVMEEQLEVLDRGVSAQGFPDRGADIRPSETANSQTPNPVLKLQESPRAGLAG